jgi:hypothetical protein
MNGAMSIILQSQDLFDGVEDRLIADINAIIPNLAYAILIGLLGFVAAQLVGGRVSRFLNRLELNEPFEDSVVGDMLLSERRTIGDLVGTVVSVYIYALTGLLIASNLNLGRVSVALNGVLEFVPTALVAFAVLAIGFWLADIVEARVAATAADNGGHVGELFGLALQVFVYLIAVAVGFGVFAGTSGGAGFAIPIVQAFALGFALAFGLAIGWGAKEYMDAGDMAGSADSN